MKNKIENSNYLKPISFPTEQMMKDASTGKNLWQSRYRNFVDRNLQLLEKEKERQRKQAKNQEQIQK